MKALVVFDTKHGTTREIAQKLANALGAGSETFELGTRGRAAIEKCDAIVGETLRRLLLGLRYRRRIRHPQGRVAAGIVERGRGPVGPGRGVRDVADERHLTLYPQDSCQGRLRLLERGRKGHPRLGQQRERRIEMTNGLSAARIAFILAVLMTAVFLQSCVTPKFDVKTPQFSSLPDGTYRGRFDGGLVKATVDVVMAGGRIEKVTIVSHRCGKGKPAEVIVDDVVREQSLEVDAISGATRSSRIILKAIEVALTP